MVDPNSFLLWYKFWILLGCDAIHRYIFSCIPFKRHKINNPKPFMSDLPLICVYMGMDYGGPFAIKESCRWNARIPKVNLALFICMPIKAVYLEIVSDFTTYVFLTALDRFITHCDILPHQYLDGGTNYAEAARQLKIMLKCAWNFNPLAAPHFGGLWKVVI